MSLFANDIESIHYVCARIRGALWKIWQIVGVKSTLCLFQDKGCIVEYDTNFEEFHGWLMSEDKAKGLDQGNIKLTFNSVSSAMPSSCLSNKI